MNLTRLLLIIGVLAAFAIAPAGRARTSDDQIKSAGGIELTTELLDKMDAATKAVRADESARTEIAAVNDTEPDAWAPTTKPSRRTSNSLRRTRNAPTALAAP